MKRLLPLGLILLITIAIPAQAQKKSTKSRAKKPAATTTPPRVDTQMEATQVADTLKSLTRFIYLYGKISNGLEMAEDQARKTKLPASVIEKNVANKNGVINGINGLKSQVDKLGTVLQANPKLQVQYINLAGVTQKIVDAISLVNSNQFDEAGKSLVTAAERLAEVLMQTK